MRRVRDGGVLWVGLASGKGRGVLVFETTYTDLGIIDEEWFHARQKDKAKHHRQNLLLGIPVRLVCTVRPNSVQVARDGEVLFEWQGNFERQLSRWDVHPTGSLYLGGWGLSGFEFDEITLEPLSEGSAWLPLFNGKDLTGWKIHPQQPHGWKVEDDLRLGQLGESRHANRS